MGHNQVQANLLQGLGGGQAPRSRGESVRRLWPWERALGTQVRRLQEAGQIPEGALCWELGAR